MTKYDLTTGHNHQKQERKWVVKTPLDQEQEKSKMASKHIKILAMKIISLLLTSLHDLQKS